MQIILSHNRADFNALASMVLAKYLYPEAKMFLVGKPTPKVRDFIVAYKNKLSIFSDEDYKNESVNLVILTGVREPYHLGKFADLVNQPFISVHVYDNHKATHQSVAGDLEVIDEQGTTVTVLLKELFKKNIVLSPFEATLCLLGIYEETGSLTYSGTTWEDIYMASQLVRMGGRLEEVSTLEQYSLNALQRGIIEKLLNAPQYFNLAGRRCLLTEAEASEHIDDLSAVADRIMELESPEALFCLINMENRSYVIARSVPGGVDVYSIIRELGGVGHSTSAFACVKHRPLEELAEEIKNIGETRVPKLLTARDLMSTPVECLEISRETSVEEASLKMQKIGHSAVCVKCASELVGMLMRSDIDKAMGHGLNGEPVLTYVNTDFISIDPRSSVKEIRRLLVENDIDRLPVLDKGELVGIVSQGDILRALNSQSLADSLNYSSLVPVEFVRLNIDVMTLLKKCGEVGAELGVSVYAVGGFVRDLLLHINNNDIDLVAEGNGVAYAKALSSVLGGVCKLHEEFGTAQLSLPDGLKLDVVTARTETYTRPAALPDVKGSTLKQDLYRRDFSINAMALRLDPDHFGELIDFFGARTDLEKGVVRILHNLSFIDDPTRIFRAIKFEQRYGFHMDINTLHLLQSAVNMGLIKMVSFERLGSEIWQILKEPYPRNSLMRMNELQVLRAMDPRLELSGEVLKILENAEILMREYRDLALSGELNQCIMYLNVLLLNLLPAKAIKTFVSQYALFPGCFNKFLLIGPEKKAEILEVLSDPDAPNSLLVKLLSSFSTEGVICLAAHSDKSAVYDNISYYLRSLRFVTSPLSGNDLIKLGYRPGPGFKKMLAWLLDEFLDGNIQNRQEAEAAVLRSYPLN